MNRLPSFLEALSAFLVLCVVTFMIFIIIILFKPIIVFGLILGIAYVIGCVALWIGSYISKLLKFPIDK